MLDSLILLCLSLVLRHVVKNAVIAVAVVRVVLVLSVVVHGR